MNQKVRVDMGLEDIVDAINGQLWKAVVWDLNAVLEDAIKNPSDDFSKEYAIAMHKLLHDYIADAGLRLD